MVRTLKDLVLVVLLLVFSLVGGAWSSCRPWYGTFASSGSNIDYCRNVLSSYPKIVCSNMVGGYFRCSSSWCGSTGGVSIDALTGRCNQCYGRHEGQSYYVGNEYNPACTWLNCQQCDTQAEADSVKCLNEGKLWQDGICKGQKEICEDSGGKWNGTSCDICNEAVSKPDECEQLYNTKGGYWYAQVWKVTYNECTKEYTKEPLSSVPEVQCTDIMSSSSRDEPIRCVAEVGYSCVMQTGSGQTYNCDCDGSCQKAMADSLCMKNPYRSSSSSQPGSSSSGSSSSGSGDSSSSSADSSSSSGESTGESSSGSDNPGFEDWEYDYRDSLRKIHENTVSMTGYLSDIDRQLSMRTREIVTATETAAERAAGATATAAERVSDSVHTTNELLRSIEGKIGMADSVDTPEDVTSWRDSVLDVIESLKNPDTTTIGVDSLKPDTSGYKSKYSSLFIRNALTRNGCYTFTMASKPEWKIGEIKIDFSKVADTFDLCSIFRGMVRIMGAILCLIITIVSYRSAFAQGE